MKSFGTYTIIVLLLFGIVAPAVAQRSVGALVGVVEYVEGEVTIDGVVADFGQEVPIGAWVQSGPGSRVDIVFDRVNIFRLGENTVAVVSIGDGRQDVDLRTGTLAAVFDRVRRLSGDEGFNVRTPTVVGGVRGTSFFFKVNSRDETYVCTCNGTIDWHSVGGEHSFQVAAPEHEAYLFRSTADGVEVEQSTLIYHDNDSLNQLAEQTNVTIPWGVVE